MSENENFQPDTSQQISDRGLDKALERLEEIQDQADQVVHDLRILRTDLHELLPMDADCTARRAVADQCDMCHGRGCVVCGFVKLWESDD